MGIFGDARTVVLQSFDCCCLCLPSGVILLQAQFPNQCVIGSKDFGHIDMADMTAISAAFAALNGVKTVAQAIIETRDSALISGKVAELNGKIIDVQNAIFRAQEERSALVEKLRDLENELARLKAWEAEKRRYSLVNIGPGVVAYRVKEAERGEEPNHHLCANCFNVGKKSFLQQKAWTQDLAEYKCNTCGELLAIRKNTGARVVRIPNPEGW